MEREAVGVAPIHIRPLERLAFYLMTGNSCKNSYKQPAASLTLASATAQVFFAFLRTFIHLGFSFCSLLDEGNNKLYYALFFFSLCSFFTFAALAKASSLSLFFFFSETGV